MVSDLEKSGEKITIGELIGKTDEKTVIDTIDACLLRYKVPKFYEYEAVSQLAKIKFLQVVPSAVLRKRALVIRD